MTVYVAQFTFHFRHKSSKRNISSFRKQTYEVSEIKHIKSKSKTYQTRLYRLIVYAGLQIRLNHVKKHISFWNKKHNHFQNSKHMPAYTMQLYMWAYKLNTKYPRIPVVVYAAYNQIAKFPRIQYGCISGLLTNYQIPVYTMWLYKRHTNKSPNSCVYNVVVYAAHK